MKVFSIIGISKTGKTTTIENIIKELKRRRYSVGSIKEIHFEKFEIDTKGSNTYRHRMAGSELVTARGYKETDILYSRKLSVDEILKHYNYDYVLMEGVTDVIAPRIVTAENVQQIEEKLDDYVFAISGKISNEIENYKGIPVINSFEKINDLVNLIENKVFEKLPNFPIECCDQCGYGCEELGVRILKGLSKRNECIISKDNIELFINDKKIDMVPFVKKILYNSVNGVVKELDGYKNNAEITIKIGKKHI